jgi:cation diffusion facilitator family transporter
MLATKENVAKLSIFSISLLIVMKVATSIVTGSISIRADAFHSLIDLSGAVIGYISIRISDKPPDEQHPFGHGKAENIAGVVIAGLIFIAAGTIFYEAIRKLTTGGTVELVTLGIYVTATAIVINMAVSWYALRVARATDSVALEATARDMFADVLSSCAVLTGLILVRLTGLNILDPIVALLVATLITRTAFITMKRSFGGLMDTRLPRSEEAEIRSCLIEHAGQLVGFHNLRTRKAGNKRYIDLHLVMPKTTSVEEAHRVCDHLEQDLEEKLKNTDVTIHVEPCTIECDRCRVPCNLRKRAH